MHNKKYRVCKQSTKVSSNKTNYKGRSISLQVNEEKHLFFNIISFLTNALNSVMNIHQAEHYTAKISAQN